MLVHGAAGGVGTASLQVAKGLGARTIAVVSSDEKERVARDGGRGRGGALRRRLEGRGEGARRRRRRASTRSAATASPTACARSNTDGRLVVVGFTGGSIPEVKVNRLLLNNIDVVGAGWGAYITKRPEVIAETAQALEGLIESGHVRPIVGARFPLEEATRALELIDGRGATGKVVLEP